MVQQLLLLLAAERYLRFNSAEAIIRRPFSLCSWNKKSILYKQLLHLVCLVSLPAALIIIRILFFPLCLHEPVGGTRGIFKKKQIHFRYSNSGCSHHWLRGILHVSASIVSSNISALSTRSDKTDRRRPFLAHWFRSSFHTLLVRADCEAEESTGRSTFTPIRFNKSEHGRRRHCCLWASFILLWILSYRWWQHQWCVKFTLNIQS